MPHQMIRVLLGLVLVLSSCHVQAMVATNEPGVPIMDVPASDIVQEMTASPVFTPPTDATDDSAAVQQLTSMVADTTVEPRHVPDGGHKVDQSGKGIGEMHRGPSIPLTENEGDKILDEIETSTPTDNIDNWNMDSLVEETKKSEERKKMIEQKHEEIQKTKLREQALKLKKKVELEQLVLEAEKDVPNGRRSTKKAKLHCTTCLKKASMPVWPQGMVANTTNPRHWLKNNCTLLR